MGIKVFLSFVLAGPLLASLEPPGLGLGRVPCPDGVRRRLHPSSDARVERAELRQAQEEDLVEEIDLVHRDLSPS